MKRIISTLAAILIIVSMLALCVDAAGGTVKMDSATAAIGDTVTLKISASGLSGITAGSIEFSSLPAGFEIKSGKWVGDYFASDFDLDGKRGVFMFSEAKNLDGELFELTVKIGDGAANKANNLDFKLQLQDNSGEFVTDFSTVGGTVTVSKKGDGDAGETDTETDTETGTDEKQETDTEETDDTSDGKSEEKTDDTADAEDTADGETDAEAKTETEKNNILPTVLICVGAAVVVAAVVFILLSGKKKKSE